MRLDVVGNLTALAEQRPVFHSEADFQHAFAFQLRSSLPNCQVRLEVPFGSDARGATDILVRRDGRVHGIELKYLTRRFACEVHGEQFALKAQGATDLRRYDVVKDLFRLERLNGVGGGPSYVIALTNDPAYWSFQSRTDLIDTDFRLHEGRVLTGQLAWAAHAGAGSIKGRETPISLAHAYHLSWSDYSNIGSDAGRFRFLCVEIP